MKAAQKLNHVQKLLAKGNLLRARKLVIQLYKSHPNDEQTLKACVLVFVKITDFKNAVFFADKLLLKDPGNFAYVTNLANWSLKLGKREQAVSYYQNYTNTFPGNPRAYFQLGILYKQALEYEQAVAMFTSAAESGFDPLEECYLNLALTHGEFRRESLAIETLKQALDVNPRHLIAMLNLATLFQAAGRNDEADDLLEQILAQDPTFSEALIRLIYSRKATRDDRHLVDAASSRVRSTLVSAIEKEGLNFALGKANDDLGEYETAFENYRKANELQARRIGAYEPTEMARYVEQCVNRANSAWVNNPTGEADFEPIFIVGHFRSGSTLVEQLLAGHSEIHSLGEVDYFLRFYQERGDKFQSFYESENHAAMQKLGDEYKKLTSTMSGCHKRITDKRPENILFMGLIKKIYPKAKFIHTRRNLLDNGISVYFQQLNDLSKFSTRLESFVDYELQCQRLMSHWRSIFAESIYEINYEDLVSDPQKHTQQLLSFLQLDWEPGCLDFKNKENFVRTASVSQVREKIYTSSVGRWMNYYPFFTDTEKASYSDNENTAAMISDWQQCLKNTASV